MYTFFNALREFLAVAMDLPFGILVACVLLVLVALMYWYMVHTSIEMPEDTYHAKQPTDDRRAV